MLQALLVEGTGGTDGPFLRFPFTCTWFPPAPHSECDHGPFSHQNEDCRDGILCCGCSACTEISSKKFILRPRKFRAPHSSGARSDRPSDHARPSLACCSATWTRHAPDSWGEQEKMNPQFSGPGMQKSFEEFCKRPENQRACEEAQREEMKQTLKVKETLSWLEFEKTLDQAGPEVQEALAPFLRHKTLRRIVQTFSNGCRSEDTQNTGKAAAVEELCAWASNPRVLGMLHAAKQLLESGSMSSRQLEYMVLQQLKNSKGAARQEFEAASSRCVILAPDKLVSALNEHLEERRKGNLSFRSGRMQEAMESYRRALAIVEFVKGGTPSDQAEIDRNQVTVLLNMAAATLALEDYGAAAQHCTRVIELEPNNDTALLRRAKAFAMRRQFEAAEKDLHALEEMHAPGAAVEGVEEVRRRMKRFQVEDKVKDRSFCSRLFA